ncbi:MAG: HNH endonuclease family protein [Candidatus Ornithobacterium hominis]|nr:HNH endonuclease family protein [Candidatus Ornithobacterium hominis]MCT7905195.1 HNH endonuclease family protein [Candidatus Ornithobacterium hominis]
MTEKEEVAKEDMILRKSAHRFETVDYDKQLFKDYVVNQTKKDKNGLDTESAKRIVNAFDFFNAYFSDKDETYLLKMLETVQNASCTTHPVKDESEAIQMFIFQNNRGKKPSNLEIIKAQFMFNVHLFGGEEKEALIEEIKSRFEKIYKSISSIEYRINEDEVLTYTLRVHFNSLWENNAIDKINSLLSEANPIPFIKLFTQSLATSFEHLTTFFGKDERENIEIHSLITLGGIGIAIPFIIKAYSFGLSTQQISQLCNKLESVVLRHRLIGTRADITSRLNGVYKEFTADNPDINPIIDRINWLKVTQDWWWAYWNDTELERALQGGINHPTAKYLLWKYENHMENQGKSGYTPTRFDKIEKPELEHIAPQTDNPESGYDKYDEEFVNQYINCLGNYLLLSKSHNCSVGNKPFADKRNSYNHLEQQREIQRMTTENIQWTRELIQSRKEKIVEFIMENV